MCFAACSCSPAAAVAGCRGHVAVGDNADCWDVDDDHVGDHHEADADDGHDLVS